MAVGPVPVAPEQDPLPQPVCPLRILVVDDVAMNREIAQSFLRAAGHDVVCADGGIEAVEFAAIEDFDVVLMDVRMPRVDGLEATRRIRLLVGARGRVPIVALTAQAFAEQVTACHLAGMDCHLAKPFTQEALLAIVDRAIAIRKDDVLAGFRRLEATAEAPVSSVKAVSLPGADLLIYNPAAFQRTAVFLPPDAVADYLNTLDSDVGALLITMRDPDVLVHGAAGLAGAVHAVAGSGGMFGFERLATAARFFERAAETASPEIQVLAEHLILVLEASLEALRQHPGVCEVVA
jgi:CheY-like chemotaxis protein